MPNNYDKLQMPFSVPAWTPFAFFVAAAICFAISIGYAAYNLTHKDMEDKVLVNSRDDGTALLQLLDDNYMSLKRITEKTINKQRKKNWSGIEAAMPDLQGFMETDFRARLEGIVFKGVIEFITGKSITAYKDAEELAKEILKSPLFSINPEILAKDASVMLREDLPYLRALVTYRCIECLMVLCLPTSESAGVITCVRNCENQLQSGKQSSFKDGGIC